jgi:CRP-like cAMP-binding protein
MIDTLDRVLLLKGVDIFSAIPGESLAPLAQLAEEVSYSAGDTIIREADLGDCLFVIADGQVDVRVGTRTVATLRDKECVGEMSLLDSEPRCASVVATTDVLLLRIGQQEFFDLLAERTEIARGVIALLTRRFRHVIRQQVHDRRSVLP